MILCATGLPRRFIENVLAHKGITTYTVNPTEKFSFSHRKVKLTDPLCAAQYLEDVFYAPPLLDFHPAEKCVILNHVRALLSGEVSPDAYRRLLAEDGRPFLGVKLSMLDLAAEPIINLPDYTQRVHSMRGVYGSEA